MKTTQTTLGAIILIIVVLAIGGWYYSMPQSSVTPQNPIPTAGSTKIGTPVTLSGLTILPTRILEDSRCPATVYCIQAGTVRIEAQVSGPAIATTTILRLATPSTFNNITLQMTTVNPEKAAGTTTPQESYTFFFETH